MMILSSSMAGFTRPPRYTSNRIAEMVLVSGMMMAAIMAMRPVFSLPYREAMMAMPKMTKFTRISHWMTGPRRLGSGSSRPKMSNASTNMMRIMTMEAKSGLP